MKGLLEKCIHRKIHYNYDCPWYKHSSDLQMNSILLTHVKAGQNLASENRNKLTDVTRISFNTFSLTVLLTTFPTCLYTDMYLYK